MTGARPGFPAVDILFPPLPAARGARILTLSLFFVGALGGFCWMHSVAGVWLALVAAAVATLAYGLGATRQARPLRRTLSWPARAASAVVHLLWLYSVLAFGSVLSWAVTAWVWLLAPLAVAAIAGALFRWPVRLPAALPMGLWIFACVFAWGREDGRVRCDDYLRLKRESVVQVLLPTHSILERCSPGRSFWVPRYPRRVWEEPGGGRLVFTTQSGIFGELPGDPSLPKELFGSICDLPLDGARKPQCLGRGKAQGMVESERHDRLYVVAWGEAIGGKRGAVYAIPRDRPLEILDETRLDGPSVELFLEPEDDYVGVFFDDATQMVPLRAGDLRANAVPVVAPFNPGDVFYDRDRREGLLCYSPKTLKRFEGGAAGLVAFRGRPFAPRALAPASTYPSMWLSLVWGCQFDPAARRAYAAVADLGLLLEIDYDTGRILRRRFIGVGMRSMVLDAPRRRLYIADFIRGDVRAFDLDTLDETGRWFAGRFVRGLTLSRDRRALLVGSNLGVLRIPLDGGGR